MFEKSSPLCIYFAEGSKEGEGERRKESKGKIKKMKLKPLSGTQLDVISCLITAENANFAHELGRDEGGVVKLTFQRWKTNKLLYDHTPL